MPDKEAGLREDISELGEKKGSLGLLMKLGSGTVLLAVIGYAASWAFVTLNTLQEGVTKNTETLQMIKEDVNKDRENMAQWGRIAENDRDITNNAVELKVLKEMLGFYIRQAERSAERSLKRDTTIRSPPKTGSVKPHKMDKLFEEFIKNGKTEKVNPEQYKNNSIQQIQQTAPR